MQLSKTLLLVTPAILPCLGLAASLEWNAAAGGAWSVPSHWTNNDIPNSSDDTIRFLAVNPDSVNTNDLPALLVNSVTVTKSTNVMDFAGNTLTCRTFAVQGFGNGTSAVLTLTNGTLVVTNTLSVGYETVSAQLYVNASMRLASNAALQVGLSTNSRALLQISDSRGNIDRQNSASLVAGNTFNAYLTDLYLAYREGGYSTVNTYGLLDLTAVTNKGLLDVAGQMLIGLDTRSSGELLVSDAVDVKVGSPQARGGKIRIGYNATVGFDSRLVLGKGRFHAYITDLLISEGLVTATLDATNVTEGVLDISKSLVINNALLANVDGGGGNLLLGDGLRIKVGDPASRGSFVLGCMGQQRNGNSRFTTGTGSFEAYVTNFWVGKDSPNSRTRTLLLDASRVSTGILTVSESMAIADYRNATDGSTTVILGNHFSTTLGAAAQRIPFIIGAFQSYAVSFTAGGVFNAYLTDMIVGTNLATVTCNLSGVTNGSISISGSLLIGNPGPTAAGELRLPAIPVSAGTLAVGSPSTGSRGTLLMTGTVFTVTNSVTADGPTAANKGRILTTVNGAPSGLDLASSASLTVNSGIISNLFLNPSNYTAIYWGLRWAGDHTNELQALRAANKLMWTTSSLNDRAVGTIGIFMDNGITYVGAPMRKFGGTVVLIQ